MEQFEQSGDEEPRPYLDLLAAAMLTCWRVKEDGCDRYRSLCNDEFGIMTECPGQMMRWVNRKDMTDE